MKVNECAVYAPIELQTSYYRVDQDQEVNSASDGQPNVCNTEVEMISKFE